MNIIQQNTKQYYFQSKIIHSESVKLGLGKNLFYTALNKCCHLINAREEKIYQRQNLRGKALHRTSYRYQ